MSCAEKKSFNAKNLLPSETQCANHRREQVHVSCLDTADRVLLEEREFAGPGGEQIEPLHQH